jgi:hypothetical protein
MILKTKATTTTMLCTTGGHGYVPGAYYRVLGTLPRELARHFREEDPPAGRSVLDLDAAAAERDMEAQRRRLEPPPRTPPTVRRSTVMKQFGWDRAMFDRAKQCGFPQATGVAWAEAGGVVRGGDSLYQPGDIERWIETMRLVAGTIPEK